MHQIVHVDGGFYEIDEDGNGPSMEDHEMISVLADGGCFDYMASLE